VLKSKLKRVELWTRGQFNRSVGLSRIPTLISRSCQVIPTGGDIRILVLRQDRIGDVLVSVPIFRALRRLFPQGQIDVVLSHNNIPVRDAISPFINAVVLYQKGPLALLKLRRTIRKRRYDVVVDCMDNASTTSSLFVNATHARYAIGIDKENRGVYTHVVPLADRSSVHIVDRISRLLWPFGVDLTTEEKQLAYPLQESDVLHAQSLVHGTSVGRKIFGFNISGSDIGRMYPEIDIIRVINEVGNLGSEVEFVILGAQQHLDMLLRISEATHCRLIEPVASFTAWAAIIAQLDGLITPDTSAVHVAAAFSVPSVVLFVHDRADLMPWYPYNTPCFACETTTSRIADIPVESVISAVRKLVIGE